MTTSLDPVFLPASGDFESLRQEVSDKNAWARMRHALGAVDFNTAYDFLRALAVEHYLRGEGQAAIEMMEQTDALIMRAGTEDGHLLNVHACLLQILTALRIETGEVATAMESAASAMTLLAQEARRKDEPFLEILAMLLFDISLLHSGRGEYKQAEREVEKGAKIFERLARINASRYGSAHLMMLNAVTSIYRDRQKQADMLAHYQASTTMYLQMLDNGMADAANRLIESLATEARTLAEMGRHRESVQFYMRALKYMTRMEESQTSLRQIELSVAMGVEMLHISAMRDKAVHLLNTMLHKAQKAGAAGLVDQVSQALSQAQTRRLDILGMWHKLFPR